MHFSLGFTHREPANRVARKVEGSDIFCGLLAQIRERFEGRRTKGPRVELDTLTEFEQAVLRKTMEIPYGEVRPYAWVAREIGRPKAVRAVGMGERPPAPPRSEPRA